MKRYKDIGKKLLLISAMAFSQLTAADTNTNHTYFAARPQGVNMAMEMPTWFGHISRKDTTFGGSLQATGFYQHSTNGKDLAKFLMFDGRDSLRIHGANAASAHADAQVHPFNFNLATGPANHDSTISLNPEQEVYGTRLDYHQELDHLLNGLYLSVSAPIVHVTNKPNLKENVAQESAHNGPHTVAQTLRGDRLTSDWSEPFRYGKINGSQSVTGLADVDARLGFNFIQKRRVRAGLELGVTIPTGNKVTGEYLFEPVVGNANHWGLGAGLNTLVAVWEDAKQRDHNVCLAVQANYRYLFKDTERRTLELKGQKWARYIRMRQVDPTDETRVLANSLPGVNALTRNLNVTPGSQVEGLATLSYHRNRWTFNAGYNVWWKEKEQVSLKGKWEDAGRFGLASSTNGFNAGGEFLGVRDADAENLIAADNAAAHAALRMINVAAPNGGALTADNISIQLATAIRMQQNANTYGATDVANAANLVTAADNHLGNPGRNVFDASVAAMIADKANQPNPGPLRSGSAAGVAAVAAAAVVRIDAQAGNEGIDLTVNDRLPQLLLPMAKAQAIDSNTTIHTYAVGNGTEIAATDVDYDAVAHPSALSHKVFANVSYDFDFDHPTYVGLGGSYEFGDSRKALDQWTVWAKFGVSF